MDKNAPTAPGRSRWLPSLPVLLSALALTISASTAAWVVLRTGPPSRLGYDFSSPEAALRSDLTMTRDGDFDAIRAHYRDFNRSVASEILKTLHIEGVREYKGAKLLYLSFTERGEPVRREEVGHAFSEEGAGALGEQVVRGGDELAHLQGAASGGVVGGGPLAQPAPVDHARLGSQDGQQRRG